MTAILELLTVNVAVSDLQRAEAAFRALGLEPVSPSYMPEPPYEITDLSFPVGDRAAVSLVEPTSDTSMVARFLKRRPPGVYSVCVRVDDLSQAMAEWSAVGIGWASAEPMVMEHHRITRYRVERLLMNWVRPSSLEGVSLEVVEFQGEVIEYL